MLDRDVLENLIKNKTRITDLVIQNTKYSVDSSEIVYSDVPVTRPTIRGGVYFSDTMEFKVKTFVTDSTISKLLTKTMLGPNTEFAKIQIIPDGETSTQIFTNLTNYVQKAGGVELNMIIVETLSAK